MISGDARCPDTLTAGLELLDSVGVPAAYVDSTGTLVLSNDAWDAVFGTKQQGPWGWLSVLLPEAAQHVQRALGSMLEAGSRAEVEVDVRGPDGSISRLNLVGGFDSSSGREHSGALVLGWDVTEQRRNEERLAFIAGHDALTGLPNRRTFRDTLDRAVSRAARGTPSILLLIDIDHLKLYNDALGHLAGDQALVNVALLIRRHVRASDIAARIGGDEFAVIMEDAGIDEAVLIAERMREAVASNDAVPGGRERSLGLSGGLVVIDAGSDSQSVLSRADVALYAAKAAGRDRMVVWDPTLAGMGRADRLGTSIRDAFDADGFHLVYQPVVRLDDMSVSYYESLVRARAADGTAYGPTEFLPFVEGMGRMSELTKRIVEMALAALSAVPACAVSVNLSASDLSDGELLDCVERQLLTSGVSADRMVFEISESTLLSNLSQGRAWMRRLGDVGASFVLDDFGSGVGMFALLREEGIDRVKLSRMVVSALSDAHSTRAFVIALRELIEAQGKSTVAAFVETEQLLGMVRDAGFSEAQGYGLATPQSDLAALVDRYGTGCG